MTARPMLLPVLLLSFNSVLVSSCAQRGTTPQVRDPESTASAPDGRRFPEFERRVQAYAELERKLESELPKLPEKAEPERIVSHKQTLAKSIQEARSGAKQGDFFIPEVRPVITQIIRGETTGPQGAEARDEIVDTAARRGVNEAPAVVALNVNAMYPGNVSLSTVPPELLLKLPRLPEEVDYRFVGRNLILRSVKANLILDVLPGALPPPATKKQR